MLIKIVTKSLILGSLGLVLLSVFWAPQLPAYNVVDEGPPVPRREAEQVFHDRLKDGSPGPAMVVIPKGNFQMGDIQDRGDKDERPVHTVRIGRSFALGKYEVTVGEFRKFVAASDYRTDAERNAGGLPGCVTLNGESFDWRARTSWRDLEFTQADDHPVVCVSWNDAMVYIAWLRRQTGKRYRLPSEAEWEYAARAGSSSNYWWGNTIGHARANCNACGSQWDLKMTAAVGSFAANAFGLHDTAGNVWEWVADCWHNSYAGAPTDGSAWHGNCAHNVIRGGSWNNSPRNVRSSFRNWYAPNNRFDNRGFRLARDL